MGIHCKYNGHFKMVAKDNGQVSAEAMAKMQACVERINAAAEESGEGGRWVFDAATRHLYIKDDEFDNYVECDDAYAAMTATAAEANCAIKGDIYCWGDNGTLADVSVDCARDNEVLTVPAIHHLISKLTIADIRALHAQIDRKREARAQKRKASQ